MLSVVCDMSACITTKRLKLGSHGFQRKVVINVSTVTLLRLTTNFEGDPFTAGADSSWVGCLATLHLGNEAKTELAPLMIINKCYIVDIFRRVLAISASRGATTSSKLGVQFLGLGYYYTSTEKKLERSTTFGAIGYIITLFIKKLRENWGVRPNFGGSGPPPPIPSGCAHVYELSTVRAQFLVCSG